MIAILSTGFTKCVITGNNFGGAIYGNILQSNVDRVCFDLCKSAWNDNSFHVTCQKLYSNIITYSNALRCCDDQSSVGRSAQLQGGNIRQSQTNHSHGYVGISNSVMRFCFLNTATDDYNIFAAMNCKKVEALDGSSSTQMQISGNIYTFNDGSGRGGQEIYDNLDSAVSNSFFIHEEFPSFREFGKLVISSAYFCSNSYSVPKKGISTAASIQAPPSPHEFVCGRVPSNNYSYKIPQHFELLTVPLLVLFFIFNESTL